MKKTLLIGTILLAISATTTLTLLNSDLPLLYASLTNPKKTTTNKNQQKRISRKSSYIGLIKKSEELIEKENYSLATLKLAQVIKKNPEIIQPYLLLGKIYIRTKDISKAENLITKLQKKFPNAPEIALLQIQKFILEENFTVASALSEKEENNKNFSPALRFYQAVFSALKNDHKRARKIINELAALPVEDKKLKVGKTGIKAEKIKTENYVTSEFAEKINKVAASYADFDELSEGQPPHLFAQIGKILAEDNETVLARKYAEVAIKEEPGYIDAWIVRGYTYFLEDNQKEALKDLRHAYELDPLRAETHYFLALALLENGKEEEAALFFEKSLEHKFEFAESLHWQLIEIYTKRKKYNRALGHYQKLTEKDVPLEKFTQALNIAINLAKKPKIAQTISESLLEKNPKKITALNLHAWALIANQQYPESQKILDTALKIDPKNPRTFLNLGLLNESQKKLTKAKEYYKKSYELSQKQKRRTSIGNLAAELFNKLLEKEKSQVAKTQQ